MQVARGDTSFVAVLGWTLVGAGFALLVSQIGLFTLPAAGLLAIVLYGRYGAGLALLAGITAGIAAICLLIAGLNQGENDLDPTGWLIVGLALLSVAALVVVRMIRLRRSAR